MRPMHPELHQGKLYGSGMLWWSHCYEPSPLRHEELDRGAQTKAVQFIYDLTGDSANDAMTLLKIRAIAAWAGANPVEKK
jgi:hypothetical protein